MSDFVSVANALLTKVKLEDFSGYDPFDSLNSSLFNRTPFAKGPLCRLAWLQFGKLSPINFRPIIGVPKRRNPKGVALFLLGLLEDFGRTGDSSFLDEARRLGDWLISERCDPTLWAHHCWGYHFDWQARAFFVPKGKPNVISTVYVARALYSLGQATHDDNYTHASYDAAYFIRAHLLTETNNKVYFAYIPGELAFVHNANLWGAAWVGFVGAKVEDSGLSDLALKVARQTCYAQATDGSWVYGERSHHQFIDGFHTGYNLEALQMLKEAQNTKEFDDYILTGLEFYKNTFFLSDGTAKYYSTSTYPLDMHSFAQAVITLITVGGKKSDYELSQKVLNRSIELMFIENKSCFIYQKNRFFSNRINYSRWTQAWSYFSLAFFNRRNASDFINETY